MIPCGLPANEIKRRADFFVIASHYTKLRRAGRQWRGRCPFHSERDPSLYIEPQRKIFHCFGCGAGGDLFSFVMLAEGCDFSAALQIVSGFVFGVAAGSEQRSCERFASGEGAKPLRVAEQPGSHSPNTHAAILARLDETERRNAAIARANEESFVESAPACESSRGEGGFSLFITNRITVPFSPGKVKAQGRGRGKPLVSPMP